MKLSRRAWVKVVVVLTVALTVAFLVFHPSEPEYQGKPLSHWLGQLPGGPHDPPFFEAEVAVRNIGTNALPFLLRSLTAEDSRFKKLLIKLDAGQTVFNLHLKSAEARAEEAAAGYVALAEIAEPAIPDLIALVASSNAMASLNAFAVLPYLGSAGFEATANLLYSTNRLYRRRAAVYLAMAGDSGLHGSYSPSTQRYRQQAGAVIPRLISLLKDPDTNVAYSATFALGSLRLRPDEVIPALTNLAANEGESLMVRGGALNAVGRFGKLAEITVPFLNTFSNDANIRIRAAASNALWRIGRGSSNSNDAK